VIPKVSILIPVYNRENFIKRTIESALSQTYENIEIVVVDNKSTDKTWEFLQEYSMKDQRIKIFQNEQNLGPVLNWKKCLEYSEGDYIKFLWSDDLISEDFLKKTVPILEKNEDIGFVYSKVKIFSELWETITYDLKISSSKIPSEIFFKGALLNEYSVPVSPGCAIFRKKDIKITELIPNGLKLSHLDYGAGNDLLIFLDVLIKYKYFYYIDEVLSMFRFHNDSLTVRNDLNDYYITSKFFFVDENNLLYFYKKLYTNTYISLLRKSKSFSFSKEKIRYIIEPFSNNEYKIDLLYLISKILKKIFRLSNDLGS